MNEADQQFAAAVAKGSGRAMILLQTGSTEEMVLALADACARNLAYDPQCEDDRAPYLAKLVLASGQASRLYHDLLKRLSEGGEEVDRVQIFRVLAHVVVSSGWEGMVLRRAYDALAVEDQFIALDGLVTLEGMSGLVEAADRLSEVLDEEPWHASGLLRALEEREGDAREGAMQAAARDPRLQALFAASSLTWQPSGDDSYDFDEVREALRLGERKRGPWLRRLSDPQWSLICRDFTQVQTAKVAVQYLRLFAYRTYDGDVRNVLHWVDSGDSDCAWLAMRASARLRSPLVRQKALERVDRGDPASVHLLNASYEQGDFERLRPILREPRSDRVLHDLGTTLLDITDQMAPAERLEALLWIYERTPCSMCRGDAVSQMVEGDRAPHSVMIECRFDADSSARAVALDYRGRERA